MEILEAFDATGSLRAAAELVGCDHKTVGHWVRARDEAGGGLPASVEAAAAGGCVRGEDRGVGGSLARQDPRRRRASEAGRDGLSGLGAHHAPGGRGGQAAVAGRARPAHAAVDHRSRGCGCSGTTATGPRSPAARTVLFCAWLAWSAVPGRDPALGQDDAVGGDGARSRAAGVRRRADLRVDRQREDGVGRSRRGDRGPQPADRRRSPVITGCRSRPACRRIRRARAARRRRSGSPRPIWSRPSTTCAAHYADFAELEQACREFCDRVNAREHRITRRPPAVMLAEERERLHKLPALPHTVCFGQTRRVSWQSTISVGGAIYSVPSSAGRRARLGARRRVELVVVHADAPDGPREVARHALTTPGRPSIHDEHYPPRPAGRAGTQAARTARPTSRRSWQIGPGAERWLIAAAAAGHDQAAAQARRGGRAGQAARRGGRRRGAHRRGGRRALRRRRPGRDPRAPPGRPGDRVSRRASEAQSLQRSTRAWEGFGA